MNYNSRKPNSTELRCPDHEWATLIEDHHAGDLICPECGVVIGDRMIDVGSEWRTFGDSDSKDNCRVGAAENPLHSSADLSTTISNGTGKASYDENGRPLYNNHRHMNSSDRSLMQVSREIDKIGDRAHLAQNIIDRAKVLFKMAHEKKSLKGRRNEAVAAALISIACRSEQASRSIKEICAISNVPTRKIGREVKLLTPLLELGLELPNNDEYIPRFCGRLSLPKPVIKLATYILHSASDLDIGNGRSPITMVATAIYMASKSLGFEKTRLEIGDACGVAEGTITQCFRSMRDRVDELFPTRNHENIQKSGDNFDITLLPKQ